jgi:hypothetical protein
MGYRSDAPKRERSDALPLLVGARGSSGRLCFREDLRSGNPASLARGSSSSRTP